MTPTMDNRYRDFMQDVMITLRANLRELRERKGFADPEELTYIEAKLLAYQELIAILEDSADEFGIPKEGLGLRDV